MLKRRLGDLRRRWVARAFQRAFYDAGVHTWQSTTWLGVPIRKSPMDILVYQELLCEVRPDFIVEAGTYQGGSALFLASICDLLGGGEVITIDVEAMERPKHPRITYLHGSSVAPEIVAAIRERAKGRGLAILDSDHSAAHVRAELDIYSSLVSRGSYLIVEDTNINGHPVASGFGPGPAEAVADFLKTTDAFVVDRHRERLMMTWNPGGYLRRIL